MCGETITSGYWQVYSTSSGAMFVYSLCLMFRRLEKQESIVKWESTASGLKWILRFTRCFLLSDQEKEHVESKGPFISSGEVCVVFSLFFLLRSWGRWSLTDVTELLRGSRLFSFAYFFLFTASLWSVTGQVKFSFLESPSGRKGIEFSPFPLGIYTSFARFVSSPKPLR